MVMSKNVQREKNVMSKHFLFTSKKTRFLAVIKTCPDLKLSKNDFDIKDVSPFPMVINCIHSRAKIKYQIPYYQSEKFKTIRSDAPIRKCTIFRNVVEQFSSRFKWFSDGLGSFSLQFLRLFGVVVVIATSFSASLSID